MVILTTVRRTPCGWHSMTLMSLIRGAGMAARGAAACSSASSEARSEGERARAGNGLEKTTAFDGHF